MGNNNSSSSESTPTTLTGPSPKRDFTLSELNENDGRTPETPIYISVKRKVFDLSSKRDFYGPGGSYANFAGKDASRCLGLNETDKETANNIRYDDLDPLSISRLENWESFYQKKYPCIGYLVIPGEDIDSIKKEFEEREKEMFAKKAEASQSQPPVNISNSEGNANQQ